MKFKFIEAILKQEGFSEIRIDDDLGWDILAYKDGERFFIEVKETEGEDYFKRNSFAYHSDKQVELFKKGEIIILFIFYGKRNITYKILDKRLRFSKNSKILH